MCLCEDNSLYEKQKKRMFMRNLLSSGMVESAVKQYKARFAGAGMR